MAEQFCRNHSTLSWPIGSPLNSRLPGLGRVQPGDQLGQRRFAAAVAADDEGDLAGLEHEVQRAEPEARPAARQRRTAAQAAAAGPPGRRGGCAGMRATVATQRAGRQPGPCASDGRQLTLVGIADAGQFQPASAAAGRPSYGSCSSSLPACITGPAHGSWPARRHRAAGPGAET